MHTFLVVVQVLVSVALIGFILLQQGKGADAGAAFGSGSSGTVFGARGAANFLSRSTAVLATIFFIVSLSLAYFVHQRDGGGGSVVERMSQDAPTAVTVPALPAVPEPEAAAPAPVAAPATTDKPVVPD